MTSSCLFEKNHLLTKLIYFMLNLQSTILKIFSTKKKRLLLKKKWARRTLNTLQKQLHIYLYHLYLYRLYIYIYLSSIYTHISSLSLSKLTCKNGSLRF